MGMLDDMTADLGGSGASNSGAIPPPPPPAATTTPTLSNNPDTGNMAAAAPATPAPAPIAPPAVTATTPAPTPALPPGSMLAAMTHDLGIPQQPTTPAAQPAATPSPKPMTGMLAAMTKDLGGSNTAPAASAAPAADAPIRLSTDSGGRTLPSTYAPPTAQGNESRNASVLAFKIGDLVQQTPQGYQLKPGVTPQRFLDELKGRAEGEAGFTPAQADAYAAKTGQRPIGRFIGGQDERNPDLTVQQILGGLTQERARPGEQLIAPDPIFQMALPNHVADLHRQFLKPDADETQANMERDIAQNRAEQQQTWADKAAKGVAPYVLGGPVGALATKTAEMAGSDTAREIRQGEEGAVKGATLGWADPTVAGRAKGEKYGVGEDIGETAGGALPSIAANVAGDIVAPGVGGAVATGALDLIRRDTSEDHYELGKRLARAVVSGSSMGIAGAVGGDGLSKFLVDQLIFTGGATGTSALIEGEAPTLKGVAKQALIGALFSASHHVMSGEHTEVDHELLGRYMDGEALTPGERSALGKQLKLDVPVPEQSPMQFKAKGVLDHATQTRQQQGSQGPELPRVPSREDVRADGGQVRQGEGGEAVAGGGAERGGQERQEQPRPQGRQVAPEPKLGKVAADPNDDSVQRFRGQDAPTPVDALGEKQVAEPASRLPPDLKPIFIHGPELRGQQSSELAARASGGTAEQDPRLQPRDHGLTGQPVTPENTKALADWTRLHPDKPPPWGGEAFTPMVKRVADTVEDALGKSEQDGKTRILTLHNSEINTIRGLAEARSRGTEDPYAVHMDTALADTQNEHGAYTRIYRGADGKAAADGKVAPEDVKPGGTYAMRHGHTPWNGPEEGGQREQDNVPVGASAVRGDTGQEVAAVQEPSGGRQQAEPPQTGQSSSRLAATAVPAPDTGQAEVGRRTGVDVDATRRELAGKPVPDIYNRPIGETTAQGIDREMAARGEGPPSMEARGAAGIGRAEPAANQQAPAVASPEQQRTTPQQPSQVAAFITTPVRQGLADLGYPKETINAMKPEEAQRVLAANERYQPAGRQDTTGGRRVPANLPTPAKKEAAPLTQRITNRDDLHRAFVDRWGLDDKVAGDTAAFWDAAGKAWQKRTGGDLKDFYGKIADVGNAEDFKRTTGRDAAAEWQAQNPGKKLGSLGAVTARVDPVETARRAIYALGSPDASSGVHELAHVFQMTALNDLPELRAEVEAHFGVDGEWTTEQKEMFARTVEAYVGSGKAPVPELQGVFDHFKEWIGQVYAAIKARGESPMHADPTKISISPEMEATLGKMLGREDGVEAPQEPLREPPAPTTSGSGEVRERQTPKSLEEAGLRGGNDRYYEVQHQPDAAARADARISGEGVASVAHDWRQSTSVSDDTTATGIALVRKYQDLATAATDPVLKAQYDGQATDVAAELARRLTSAGQMVSAANLLSADTPEGALKIATRMVQRGNPDGKVSVAAATAIREGVAEVRAVKAEKAAAEAKAADKELVAAVRRGGRSREPETLRMDARVRAHNALAALHERGTFEASEKGPSFQAAAKDPEDELRAAVKDLARAHVSLGVNTAEGLVKAVHADINDPAVTPRMVRDYISGYGQETAPTPRGVLPMLQRHMDLISRIEDVKGGQRPEVRGPNAPPDARTAALRGELKAAMDEAGFKPQKPPPSVEKQTAAITKSIADLDAQIAEVQRAGQPAARSGRAAGPTTPELETLKAERAAKAKMLATLERNTAAGQVKQDATNLKAFKTRTQARIDEVNRQQVEAERTGARPGPKPPKPPPVRDAEAADLDARLKAAQYKLAKTFQKLEKTSAARTVVSVMKASMLTGTLSMVKHVGSVASFAGFEELRRIPSSIIDMTLAAARGTERQVSGPDLGAVGRASWEAVTKGSGEFMDIMRHGITQEEADRLQLRGELNSGVAALDHAVNFVFRTRGAVDAVAMRYLTRRSLEAQAAVAVKNGSAASRAELIANPTPEMTATALQDAMIGTFKNDNPLSSAWSSFKGGLERNTKSGIGRDIVEAAVPFDKTPTNAVIRAIEASPAGAAWEAAKLSGRAVQAFRGKLDAVFTDEQAKRFADTVGRSATGTGLFAVAGYSLAKAGLLIGAASDDQKKERQAKSQPYGPAVKVGSHWIPIDPLGGVMGAMLGYGGTIYDSEQRGKGSTIDRGVEGAVRALKHTASEQPLAGEAKEIDESLKTGKEKATPGDVAVNAAGVAARRFIPQFIQEQARALDPKARQGYIDAYLNSTAAKPRQPAGFGQQLEVGLPGARQNVPAR